MSYAGEIAKFAHNPEPAFDNGGADGTASPIVFGGATEPAALDAMGTVCSYARNETIFVEGDTMSASYKILRGVVRLCRLTADGRRQIAGFRMPGDLIGVEWSGHYAMTAEAVRDVVAVRYTFSRLERLSHERTEIRDHLMDHLRHNLRAAQEHLITLGCQSANERVASFLLHLTRRAGAAEGTVIDMQLGRQDIADYLGLTLETVSRTFSDLTTRGIIASPKRRHVVIRSISRLRAHAMGAN